MNRSSAFVHIQKTMWWKPRYNKIRGDRPVSPLWQYSAGFLAVATCTALAWPLRTHLNPANLVLIYLIGVVYAAAKLHLRAALFTSVLSVAAFDFFCVPHYFSFV